MRPVPLRAGLVLAFVAVLAIAVTVGRLVVLSRAGGSRMEPAAEVFDGDTSRSLSRGVDWLCAQQDDDGGWRSKTYGAMSGGAGNTALAVYALAGLPENIRTRCAPSIRRGLGFLTSHLDSDGFVRGPDGSSDYPTYATALTLIAIHRFAPDEWPTEQRRMRDYLRKTQLRSTTSNSSDSPNRGGWDHTGGRLTEDSPQHTDVGVTAFVLEALHEGQALEAEVVEPALDYLSRCQNDQIGAQGDGGFFFSPVREDERNKAGWVDTAGRVRLPRSYGTASVDGLHGLLLCGLPRSHPRVKAAVEWIRQHPDLGSVPGVSKSVDGADWGGGLRFYYFARLSRLTSSVPGLASDDREKRLSVEVQKSQRDDGSWQNDVNTMREDDPLIATALSLDALSALFPRHDAPSTPPSPTEPR